MKLADLSKKAGSKTATERQYDGRKIKSTLRLKTYAAASPIGDKYNMKNMYKANRQRLTDIPHAHNPTDVNKNLFSLKTFRQQKHATKT